MMQKACTIPDGSDRIPGCGSSIAQRWRFALAGIRDLLRTGDRDGTQPPRAPAGAGRSGLRAARGTAEQARRSGQDAVVCRIIEQNTLPREQPAPAEGR